MTWAPFQIAAESQRRALQITYLLTYLYASAGALKEAPLAAEARSQLGSRGGVPHHEQVTGTSERRILQTSVTRIQGVQSRELTTTLQKQCPEIYVTTMQVGKMPDSIDSS